MKKWLLAVVLTSSFCGLLNRNAVSSVLIDYPEYTEERYYSDWPNGIPTPNHASWEVIMRFKNPMIRVSASASCGTGLGALIGFTDGTSIELALGSDYYSRLGVLDYRAQPGMQIAYVSFFHNLDDPTASIWVSLAGCIRCSAETDTDQDGLSNLAEFALATDYFLPDTDHDGLTDKYELALGSNPRDALSGKDVVDDHRTLDGASTHSLMVRGDGTVLAWGDNARGQLGDGTTTRRSQPGLVNGLSDVVEVDAENVHSVALAVDGKVYVWGDNSYGDLGLGTSGNYLTQPAPVPGLPFMKNIAAGYYHNLGLTPEGEVWAWGSGWEGELGVGIQGTGKLPVKLGLTEVIAIAAGVRHSMALKGDGTVWTWGRNDKGQIGDGTTVNAPYPVMVEGLPAAVAIADGNYYSLALCADGTVWAWGNNANGQLGNNSRINSAVPVRVQIPNQEPVLAIDAGYYTAMALASREVALHEDKVLQLNGDDDGDGIADRMAATSYSDVKDNFTVEFRVKAQEVHEIDEQSSSGHLGTEGQKYVLWPQNGGALEAGVGISVGVNGVSVYEHGSCYMPAVLVAKLPLGTEWNHVAVVYSDKWARLYVNGKFIKWGCSASSRTHVYPGSVFGHVAYGYFTGLIDDIRVWNYARSEAEIAENMNCETISGSSLGLVGNWTFEDGTANDASPAQKQGTLYEQACITTVEIPEDKETDGTLYVWGAGGNGQLGGNSTADSLVPVPLAGAEEAGLNYADIILGAGGWHNLAARNGSVYSWGVNHEGQLGYTTTFTHRQPVVKIMEPQ